VPSSVWIADTPMPYFPLAESATFRGQLRPGLRRLGRIDAAGAQHVLVHVEHQRVHFTRHGELLALENRGRPGAREEAAPGKSLRGRDLGTDFLQHALAGKARDRGVIDGDQVGHVAGGDRLDQLLRQLPERNRLAVDLHIGPRLVEASDVDQARLCRIAEDVPERHRGRGPGRAGTERERGGTCCRQSAEGTSFHAPILHMCAGKTPRALPSVRSQCRSRRGIEPL
jgi:hypothetical protein